MRNVWKGLVVGGLTGVAAGVILDAFAKASQKAAAIGDQVRDHIPEAGRRAKAVAGRAGEWLHDFEVPEHVLSVADRLKDTEAANRMSDMGNGINTVASDRAVSYRA